MMMTDVCITILCKLDSILYLSSFPHTNAELDDPKVFQQKTSRDSRVLRVARGSGRSIREVNELLDQYKYFGDMIKKFGDMRLFGKDGNINMRNLMSNPMMKNMPIGRMGNMGTSFCCCCVVVVTHFLYRHQHAESAQDGQPNAVWKDDGQEVAALFWLFGTKKIHISVNLHSVVVHSQVHCSTLTIPAR